MCKRALLIIYLFVFNNRNILILSARKPKKKRKRRRRKRRQKNHRKRRRKRKRKVRGHLQKYHDIVQAKTLSLFVLIFCCYCANCCHEYKVKKRANRNRRATRKKMEKKKRKRKKVRVSVGVSVGVVNPRYTPSFFILLLFFTIFAKFELDFLLLFYSLLIQIISYMSFFRFHS